MDKAGIKTNMSEWSMEPEVPDKDSDDMTILLLGDSDVGKTTFLSNTAGAPPPYSLPKFRDIDQPLNFNMRIRNENVRFLFYDTNSPENYTLLKPDLIVLCFDISNRLSLESLGKRWKIELQTHFNYDEALPVMMLGLKRDERREWTREEKEKGVGATLMPMECLGMAQSMRCDLYGECSALTGELFQEVVEDIAKTIAARLRGKSGKSEGTNCTVM